MEPAGKVQGVIFAPEVNCYKVPHRPHLSRVRDCVRGIHRAHIVNESDVAAVILEPVVGRTAC